MLNKEVYALNKEVYLVGKGLSLDYLTAEQFPHDYPIICINESCQKIHSLGLPNRIIGCCKEAIPKEHICPYVDEIWTTQQNHFDTATIIPDTHGYETVNVCIDHLIKQNVKIVHALAFDYFCNGSNKYTRTVRRSIIKDGDEPILNLTMQTVLKQKIIFNVVNTVRLIHE
jgi:hypothetical protein